MDRLLDSKFWRERSAREKTLLMAGASVLLLAFVFLVMIEPALDGRAHWQQALPSLRRELAEMRSLQKRLEPNAALATAPGRGADRASLERSLAQSGMTPVSLVESDGILRLRATDVSFSALNQWLLKAQQEQSWSVTEADISARERLDRVDVTLALRPSGMAP